MSQTGASRGRVMLIAGVATALIAMAGASIATSAPNDQADLKITKTDSPDPVVEGGNIVYTLAAENLGPDAATGVTVTDKLPAGIDFVSATTTAGTCATKGREVTCTIGNLAVGATATATITVKTRKAGTITNTATIDSIEMDAVTANNTSTATTVVRAATTPPAPTGAMCRGVTATLFGTGGNDRIVGTPNRDVIAAFAGDDVIIGFGGKDLICAGRGADVVRAGALADRVIGSAGSDRLLGGTGADRLFGNAGRDALRGNAGNDLLAGGRNSDLCRGGLGADVLRSCER